MADIVKDMIKESLDAYVEGNVDRAYEVCKRMMRLMLFIRNILRNF